MLKLWYLILSFLILISIIIGIAGPYLISEKSTEAVIAGVFLIFCILPLILKFFVPRIITAAKLFLEKCKEKEENE